MICTKLPSCNFPIEDHDVFISAIFSPVITLFEIIIIFIFSKSSSVIFEDLNAPNNKFIMPLRLVSGVPMARSSWSPFAKRSRWAKLIA